MDPITMAALVQLGELAIQTGLTYMKLSGKTAEEVHALFLSTQAVFEQKDPANLPKP
jgi:hypothetical protein